MSNGFETCDQHTYLFATEGKDCPYCEIDRLKAELEEASTIANDNYQVILKCNAQINDYKRQLDASQALLAEAEYQIEKQTIETRAATQLASDYIKQLAEARVEIERLSSPDYYACAMCPDVKEARQEVARTVERHLLGMFWCIPSKENEPMIYRDQAIEWLRGAFGLEG